MDKKKLNLNLALKDFREIEFSFIDLNPDLQNDFNPDNLKVGFSFKFDIQDENDIFDIFLKVNYEYLHSNDDKFSPLKYESRVRFELKNMKNFVDTENNAINIPDAVMTTLVGLVVSTARGVLIEKTKGSFIGKFFIPIINIKKLLNNLNIEKIEVPADNKSEITS